MGEISKKEKLLSLHRYYIWANKMRDQFDLMIKTSVSQDGTNGLDAFMYMGYWYAALYLVADGWLELKLKDEVIRASKIE